ncbi:hypothetical protein COBT_001346 [Conglomerata obtusa]
MNRKVSSNLQSYTSLVETTKSPSITLTEIMSNNDSLIDTLGLIYTLTTKHESIHSEVLSICKKIDTKEEDYAVKEWVIKILFVIFEKIKKKNEIKKEALRILSEIKFDLTNFILSALNHEENIEIVKEIISHVKFYGIIPEILKEIKRNNSINIIKNVPSILTNFHEFLSKEEIDFLCESEHSFLRSCFIDILYKKIIESKTEKREKENVNPTSASSESIEDEVVVEKNEALDEQTIYLFMERLSDINHFVRARALQLIGNLFNEGFINDKLLEVLIVVGNKILDKTCIVRKRAICFFSNFLMIRDQEIINSELNDIIHMALQKSLLLMNMKITTEVLEIIHFIKLSYFYKIKNSKAAFESIFNLIWDQKTKKIVLECIKEIIDRSDPINFFYSFCKENESYKKTIKSIKFKNNWIERMQNDFYSGNFYYESSFILSNVKRIKFDPRLISHSTIVLFKSSSQEELIENCKIYKNVLKIVLRSESCKCNNIKCNLCEIKEESLIQIIKNLVKMNFIEYEIIDLTIRILFKNKNFEKNIKKMIELLNLKDDNIKIVYSLGTICTEVNNFLENIEKNVKNIKLDETIDEKIKEKRKSITKLNLKRLSVSVNNTFIENSVIENTFVNQSVVDCTFLKDLKEKEDKEEVSDFIFYLKEKEMIYSKESLIREYIPLLKEMLREINYNKLINNKIFNEIENNIDDNNIEYIVNNENNNIENINIEINSGKNKSSNNEGKYSLEIKTNEEIQNIAYITLYKIMLCSSEFFLENIEYLEKGLNSKNLLVKNSSIFALADFITLYSAWVENFNIYLFNILENEENIIIKKNCIIIIYKLIKKNYIKIKGYGRIFVKLINDNEIGDVFMKIINSSTENDISNMIYEALTEKEIDSDLLYCVEKLMKFIDKEKVKESLFNKICDKNKNEESVEKIRKIILA